MRKFIFILMLVPFFGATTAKDVGAQVEMKGFNKLVEKNKADMKKRGAAAKESRVNDCDQILKYLTSAANGKATNKYLLALELWDNEKCFLEYPEAIENLFINARD